MSDPGPCELLEWDSQFFGFPIGRVIEPALTPQRCEQIDRQCREMGVKCVYFRTSAYESTHVRLAEVHGFRLVDLKTTLDRKIDQTFTPRIVASRIRRATPADLPRLEAIAAQAHRNTRFYFDGRFPIERCEELYRTWIRNHVTSGRDDVAIAEADGAIAGYSASYPPDRSGGVISLMAVADGFHGRRIGIDLVNASLGFFKDAGAITVRVTTQGWNIAALRVYQRCGFRTSIADLYYHKWFD